MPTIHVVVEIRLVNMSLVANIEYNRNLFDHYNTEKNIFKSVPGLTKELVIKISQDKNEPEWMLKKRLDALSLFNQTTIPNWGPDLGNLNLNEISYYIRPDAKRSNNWEELPEDIKKTFDRLGIPEAEKKYLSGAGAQYDSEVIYHNLKKEWEDQGVIFEDCDTALKKYPELMKKYFMTKCIPINDHKFIMLHAAVWSGGTFIYVPKNVKVTVPLQAYFRMNAKQGGQFEHTLIIADEGSEVHYIEGCSAPQYSKKSLHAGCVEIYVHKNAKVRYSSVENWSKNTYNLNTKRAIVYEEGIMDWINGNMGSCTTMLYPCSVLVGKGARTDMLGVVYAGFSQNQDTGSKVIHAAPNTYSTIRSKSISKNGGISSYRGYVMINKGAFNCKSNIVCDALILDNESKSNTFPSMRILDNSANVCHEATAGKISEEKIFYLMSRGLSEEQAIKMAVSGFIEPVLKQLPLEYALELNKLIQLEMENKVG